jgi:hypothetical protein
MSVYWCRSVLITAPSGNLGSDSQLPVFHYTSNMGIFIEDRYPIITHEMTSSHVERALGFQADKTLILIMQTDYHRFQIENYIKHIFIYTLNRAVFMNNVIKLNLGYCCAFKGRKQNPTQ